MKKLISLTLALMLVFSLATVAMAANFDSAGNQVTYPQQNGYTDISTVKIHKTYELAGTTGESPAEKFGFTIAAGWNGTYVENPGTGVTNDSTILCPTIVGGGVSFAKGAAGSATKVQDVVITLPTYTNVGIYHYTITETASSTAGVTSHSTPIHLVVSVIQQGTNQIRVAAVHTEVSGTKSDAITNTYTAGSLKVQKEVEGYYGDLNKDFTIEITFTPENGKQFAAGDVQITTTAPTDVVTRTNNADGSVKYSIVVSDGESVTFENVPSGTKYSVSEPTPGDYTVTYDTNKEGTITNGAVTTIVTNTKDGTVDTGITLDSLPFVLILAVCAGAVVLFVIKRRNSAEF